MKSCPSCRRTFEDTFTFCLADGALLDPPFDPEIGPLPASADDSGPATHVMTDVPPPPPVFRQPQMHTRAAPAMRPTVAQGVRPRRQTAPQVAKYLGSRKPSGGPLNEFLVVSAVLVFMLAVFLAIATNSRAFVIGCVATALALTLIRIFRK